MAIAVNPTDTNITSTSGDESQIGTQPVPQATTTSTDSLGSGVIPALPEILQQPAVRKAFPIIIVVLTVAVFAISYLWMDSGSYRSVYPGMTETDRQAAFEALTSADFDAKIDISTGDLKVPTKKYHQARIFLASRGLPQGSTGGGINSLNDETSMTTSQFMEQVKYVSAMEQELARSITQIATIKSARVHLATTKESAFVRNRTPAKASVVVTPHSGRVVSSSQVEAIVHMVSSSVPHLDADSVVVVDQRGNLLTDANRLPGMQMSNVQIEHKRVLEETYRTRIDALLGPIVGESNLRAEVDVTMDFTQVETTFEEYDTNNTGPKARSESLTVNRDSGMEAKGVPGAMTNTAPPAAEVEVDGQNEAITLPNQGEELNVRSSKTTRNYEIDRSVRHVKNQVGTVERISVAVVVNEDLLLKDEEPIERNTNDDEGDDSNENPALSPQNQQDVEARKALEVERLTTLVKGVVGFDEKRGDIVTVVATKFEPIKEEEAVKWYENQLVMDSIKSLALVVAFIAFVLAIIRPIVKSYLPADETGMDDDDLKTRFKDGELSDEELELIELGDEESLEDIKAKLKPKKSTISADMLDTANTYDDKVALVRLLVAEDAGRVANVLKKMIRSATN
ncbi:MAG: flagellar basal-body MS-ring/collar protein FliF [Pseudomonadota bacterium]|nr:flagellar basal-body MS-ring/collar protein FliF [Pseudomonadota bacterium]